MMKKTLGLPENGLRRMSATELFKRKREQVQRVPAPIEENGLKRPVTQPMMMPRGS